MQRREEIERARSYLERKEREKELTYEEIATILAGVIMFILGICVGYLF